MKIDVTRTILDVNDEPFTEKDKPVTLKTIVVNALLAQFADEGNLSGEDKMKRYTLAMRVNKAAVVTLKSEEVTEIKRLIAKGWPALIVGRTYELLDEAEKESTT